MRQERNWKSRYWYLVFVFADYYMYHISFNCAQGCANYGFNDLKVILSWKTYVEHTE